MTSSTDSIYQTPESIAWRFQSADRLPRAGLDAICEEVIVRDNVGL
jgi:hypothetical protein